MRLVKPRRPWQPCRMSDSTVHDFLIRRLPAERQNLIVLKFVEHLSNAEIGEIMGRSEGAVKSLYHRTLLALRDELEGIESDMD